VDELLIVAIFMLSTMVVLSVVILLQQRTIMSERQEHRREIGEFALRIMSRSAAEYSLAESKLMQAENGSAPQREYERLEQVGI
jgi:hypothetical protein